MDLFDVFQNYKISTTNLLISLYTVTGRILFRHKIFHNKHKYLLAIEPFYTQKTG